MKNIQSRTFVVCFSALCGGNPICRSGFVPLDWENQIGISDLSSGEPNCSNMGFEKYLQIYSVRTGPVWIKWM